MPGDDDHNYYATRERHARALAASAEKPEIRAIHLDMAERYAKLKDTGGTARQLL